MATTTTNIKINIVEPGSFTPVDPTDSITTTTDISTPDTGLFTHGIGGTEATIIGSALFLLLSSLIVAILYKKHIKQGKVTKLVHIINQCKTVFTSKKRITASLSALALLASVGTLAILLAKSGKSNTNATEGNESSSLTLDVDSEELTIEVGDEPVFAVLPVGLTVEETTQAGYTLTAYTDSTDIVSTTDSSNKIPMATLPEPIEPNEEGVGKGWSPVTTLTDNTWGLSLEQPQDQNSEVYTTLSTDQSNPTILKSIDDYSETEENDTTTIYYGFYITPDTPKGIYEGSSINYSATPNYITTLSFNGNGNDGGEDMDNIIIPAGTTITLPENTYTKEGYHFTSWDTDAEGAGDTYSDEAEYAAIAGESANVTLYAQWEEDVLYMQDVATWGSTLSIGDEVIAVDSRDDKEYYVARLADGNIWMTQNLDLDLNSQTTLTPENTNISASWTPVNSTIQFTGGEVDEWEVSRNIPSSADPGELYIYSSGTIDDDMQYLSLAACQETHPDCSAHNHAGNYYNWSAAVVSNDTSSMTEQYDNAPDSICPAGWRLPIGRDSANTASSREWNALLMAESIMNEPTGIGYDVDGFNKIRIASLWLVRSGYITYGSQTTLSWVGSTGEYHTSTVGGIGTSYNLFISEYNLNPAYASNRPIGYPVRCLVK